MASNEEVDWSELEMPSAPEVARVGRRAPWLNERILRKGLAFALFGVSILLSLYVVGLMEEGFLAPPAELGERHQAFIEITGFDNVSSSGDGVAVCVVDSGIDLSHTDLAHVQLAGWKDFVNDREAPYDDEGHGTAMAGILVAANLLPGVAPDVDLHIAKAIAKTGTGSDQDIADAIDWCRDQSVDIISLSLGGSQGIDLIFLETDALEAAVDRALDDGIYVVAAAGNDGGADDDGDVASPGSVADVICVGAIDIDGDLWASSSTGDQGIDPPNRWLPRQNPDKKPELVAPGERLPVLQADVGGAESDYAWGSGTSGATVWVSAALAHLLEVRTDLQPEGAAGGRGTVEDVKGWIRDSVEPQAGQTDHDDDYGYGRLRVDALIAVVGQS